MFCTRAIIPEEIFNSIVTLYLNSQNELIDFYNGVEDIKNCSLKFIGNINKRFLEDNLRILRYCRFCSLFEKPKLPLDHVDSLKKNSHLLKDLLGSLNL